jgi:hypothetical protein
MIAQIELGDKQRGIRFGNAALIEFEEATGLNFLVGFEKPLSLKQVSMLAFCGLKDAARFNAETIDFTQDDVIEWLNKPGSIVEVLAVFGRAVPQVLGTQVEVGAEKKTASSKSK